LKVLSVCRFTGCHQTFKGKFTLIFTVHFIKLFVWRFPTTCTTYT